MGSPKAFEPEWAVKMCESCPYPDCVQCLSAYVNEGALLMAYERELERRKSFSRDDFVQRWIHYVHSHEFEETFGTFDLRGFLRCYNLRLSDWYIAAYLKIPEETVKTYRKRLRLPSATSKKWKTVKMEILKRRMEDLK